MKLRPNRIIFNSYIILLFISILCILLNIYHYSNHHYPHPTTTNNNYGWFSYTRDIIQRRLYEVSINSTAIKGFKGLTF